MTTSSSQFPNSATTTHPVGGAGGGAGAAAAAAEEEEIYDLYPASGPLPYPKAGNGVPLPREKDDLAFLIDDDAITFSHVWSWNRRDLFGENEREKGMELGWGDAPPLGGGVAMSTGVGVGVAG